MFALTSTATEGTIVIVTEDVLEELCTNRQADASLALGREGSEKRGTDSLKTLQQNKSKQKENKLRLCKWSREGRLNSVLTSGDDKDGYVFTE